MTGRAAYSFRIAAAVKHYICTVCRKRPRTKKKSKTGRAYQVCDECLKIWQR